MWRQPTGLGSAASAELLKLLGFDEVYRDERGYVTATIPDATFGYILTQFADKYGRAVAMVFPGMQDAAGLDGSQV